MVLALAIASILMRRRYRLPGRNDLKEIWPAAALFLCTVVTAYFIDWGRASSDSLMQLILANELTAVTLADRTLAEYAYFTTLQAAFSITMVGSFGYFCYCGLIQRKMLPFQARLVSILVAIFLLSSPFIFFQFYYIHNNIAAAMYLLIGVGTLWLALTNASRNFHWICVFALLGFCLTRTESVLFAILFLAVALSSDRLLSRDWLIKLFPFTLFLAVWQLWLLFVARPTTHILTPERILILLGVILGFYLAVVMKRISFLNRLLIHHLHQIMILVFVLATIIMLFVNFEFVFLSIKYTLLNLFTVGWLWWGIVWWVAAAWLLSFPYASTFPQEKLFVFGIVGFFMLVMVIGFAHGYGRLGWYSSPNRLYLHILPVVLLYLTLKTAPLMMKESLVATKTKATND